MSQESEIVALQEALKKKLPLLNQAADAVKDQDVSNYPIFVVFKGESIGVGLPIVEEEAENWSIYISTLEELVARRVVEEAKVDDFRKLYKEKTNSICLLVWQAPSARFVFIPNID